jgi:hypothetical protein
MALNRGFFATLFMLLAFVFFVVLALIEGDVIFHTMAMWPLGGGLASMALSFLLGGAYGGWTRTGGTA